MYGSASSLRDLCRRCRKHASQEITIGDSRCLGIEPMCRDIPVGMGYPGPLYSRMRRRIGVLGNLCNEQLEIRVLLLSFERLIGAIVLSVDSPQPVAQSLR